MWHDAHAEVRVFGGKLPHPKVVDAKFGIQSLK